MTNNLHSFINSESTYSGLAKEFHFNFTEVQITMMIFALIDICNNKKSVIEVLSTLIANSDLETKEIAYN